MRDLVVREGLGGDGLRRRRPAARPDRRRRGDSLRGPRARRRLAAVPLRAADRALRPRPRGASSASSTPSAPAAPRSRRAGSPPATCRSSGSASRPSRARGPSSPGLVFLCRLWMGSSDFSLDDERLDLAIEEIEAGLDVDAGQIEVIVPLRGLQMPVARLDLAGASIVRADTVDVPPEARSSDGLGISPWEHAVPGRGPGLRARADDRGEVVEAGRLRGRVLPPADHHPAPLQGRGRRPRPARLDPDRRRSLAPDRHRLRTPPPRRLPTEPRTSWSSWPRSRAR